MRYMMATKSVHPQGEIELEKPKLCLILHEDEDGYFIGNWVNGYGAANVKFPKNTTRELTDEEREEWHGRKIKVRGKHFCTVFTKEVKLAEAEMIVLPDSEEREELLREKLARHKRQMDPYRAPRLQMDIVCKIAVLAELLREGRVNPKELSRKMAEIHKRGFDKYAFNDACIVIKNLLSTDA